MPIIVDKGKKRRDIIEAAIAVFSRTGYRRAKMQDIADQAGIGKGTVYEYFRTKQDLFLQASEYLFEQYLLEQGEILGSVAEPEEQVRALIVSTFEQAAMWTGLAYLYIDVWSEMDRKGEEDKLRTLMASVLARFTRTLAEYIRDAQERGLFRGFDPTLVAHIIIAALDGLMLQLLIHTHIFDPMAMADTLSDVLLKGLSRPE